MITKLSFRLEQPNALCNRRASMVPVYAVVADLTLRRDSYGVKCQNIPDTFGQDILDTF